jgi:hypothetical protein
MVTASTQEASSISQRIHSCTRTRRVEMRQHYRISGQQQTDHHLELDNEVTIRKMELAAAGLPEYVSKQLTGLFQLSPENALNTIDFILTQKTEVNISDTYRINMISTLVLLSKFLNHKAFKDMKREDILLYLDSLRKQEASDPLHKWVGSYNVKRQRFIKFFRWLYNPDKIPSARQTPEFMEQIPPLKRKEQSIYKPTDLWTNEDDLLFLKYCPSKRDKCYHAVSRDASGRPHEILGVKLRSVVFKVTANNKQYAEVLINGKTGSRSIPLFDSIPHIKDWISSHPQPGNPNALLFPSLSHQRFGRKLTSSVVGSIYRRYKTQFFPQLLEDPNIAPEDKNKIRELLKKPWNPYIRRHSALTEKSTILREHTLRQHAGWSARSNMHLKYLHYFGNESNDSLLEAYGIVTKDKNQQSVLRPKQCPNCNEPNKPDSKFCAKCRMVLTYDAYSETLESEKQKEDRVSVLEKQMQSLVSTLSKLTEQGQVNAVAQTLYSSGILKEGAENNR